MTDKGPGRFAMEEEASPENIRAFAHHGKDGYDFRYTIRLTDSPMPLSSVSVTRGEERVLVDSAGVSSTAEAEAFFERHADLW